MKRRLLIADLGLIDYLKAHELQLKLLDLRIREDIPDSFLLLEHPHVITLGRRAKNIDLKVPEIPVIKVERGGEATYHGPGQLIGYLIMGLRDLKLDIKRFVYLIEEAIIRALRDFSIIGSRVQGYPGVWIRDKKIASIGLAIKHWVTYHGFALNVYPDMKYFKLIKPCGLEPSTMTSMEIELGFKPDMTHVKESIIDHFKNLFGYDEAIRIEKISLESVLSRGSFELMDKSRI